MWSKIDAKVTNGSSESSTPAHVAPLAGHSLVSGEFKSYLFEESIISIEWYLMELFFFSLFQISWDDKILSIAGHTKDPSETVTGFIYFEVDILENLLSAQLPVE